MRTATTLREALADRQLLGGALSGDSWSLWRTILLATMGEPLTEPERLDFASVTGRELPPAHRVTEALFMVGRRGGKDRAAAVLAAYLATLVDWRAVLSPGERGLVLLIGPDQRQARIQFDYISAVLDGSPLLSQLVTHRTSDTVELRGRIAIEVRAASFRRLRGVTCCAVIASETAFWLDDESGANSDEAILAAVRPTLATTGGPMVQITSPWMRSGETWKTFERHYGVEDASVLVAHGTSRRFNPTLPQAVIDAAMARDPASARCEFLAEFRDPAAALIPHDVLQRSVAAGIVERPRPTRVNDADPELVAAFDASTGSGEDASALGVAQALEDGRARLLVARHWQPPFDPARVIAEAADLLHRYGINRVLIDRFAPGLVASMFRERKVEAEQSDLTTSQQYAEALTLLNAGRLELLDSPRLIGELSRLIRSPRSGGGEKIDHPRTGHDDLAAACCSALVAAAGGAEEDTRQFGVWGTGRLGASGRGGAFDPTIRARHELSLLADLHEAGAAPTWDERLRGMGVAVDLTPPTISSPADRFPVPITTGQGLLDENATAIERGRERHWGDRPSIRHGIGAAPTSER